MMPCVCDLIGGKKGGRVCVSIRDAAAAAARKGERRGVYDDLFSYLMMKIGDGFSDFFDGL